MFHYSAEAESLLKQALAQDPGFIDAKLSLARNQSMMFGTGLIDAEEYARRSLPLLDQVDSVQADNPVARALRLMTSLVDNSESADQQTIDELAAILTAIPTETFIRSTVAIWLTNFYNEKERALQIVVAGLLVDPLDAFLHSRKGEVLGDLGRFDEARAAMNRAIELQPGYASAYSKMAGIMGELGDLPAKLDWARQAVEVDPEDHELAASLAYDLYWLGLPEEGDRWANRVMALAPESDVARAIKLTGLQSHGRWTEAEATAKSMIADQVSPRQGAIWDAVFGYQQMVTNDHRDQEGLEFLESVRPEIADYSRLPGGQSGTAMQWAAIMLAHQTLGPEVSRERWAKLTANLEKHGGAWWTEDAEFSMMKPFLDGDLDSAAEVALELGLNKPVAEWPARTGIYRQPMFESLAAHPLVAKRLAERDRELADARADVLKMLEGPEWQ
jgi:tetratricopeptide (TPR) repeat protein